MIRMRFRVALELAVCAFMLNMYLVQVTTTSTALATAVIIRPASFSSMNNIPDAEAIFVQVNQARQLAGLGQLERNYDLMNLAQSRAEDMRRNSYYSHTSSGGMMFDDIAKQSGFVFDYGCENLNLDFTITPEIYVHSWLNSKAGHRECALNPTVTEAGYAVVELLPMSGQSINSYVVVAVHTTATTTFTQ